MRKILVFLLIFFLEISILSFSKPVTAKADDLVIEDSGAVEILITQSSVMGTETSAPSPTTSTQTPSATTSPTTTPLKTSTPVPTPTTAPKVVPVAPANSNTTVKISPTTTNNKLNITIETTKVTATPTPAPTVVKPGATATVKPSTTPASSPSPTPITSSATVDNVILRNADKQPVLTIQANQNQSNQVNIEQKNVNVTTNLPLQIDSKTHIVSVDTGGSTSEVNILPDQAVKGAAQKLTSSNLTIINSNVSLIQDKGEAEYVINQTKTGKLLGLFNVTLPSQVKISAQTGKTISVWQSPLSYLSGFLIK